MRILDRYIGLSVAYATIFVMLVLVALFTFFTFAGELNKTGKGDYDSWQALQFALLTIPSMLYQIFPAAALIGVMSGLGVLANNSELIAMRAAGYSLYKILRSVFVFSFILMITVGLIGELVAPASQVYAETKRNIALSGKSAVQTRGGIWLKDGERFIRVGSIESSSGLSDIQIYELDAKQGLVEFSRIEHALSLGKQNWQLSGYESFRVQNDNMLIQHQESARKQNLISSDVLDMLSVSPESMSAMATYQYIDYLEENDIDTSHYSQAFWMKVSTPLATVVMVLLAIPIVMGSIRTMTAGHRILIGTLTGIGFYLLSQVFAYMGLVFSIPPMLTAFIPLLVFLFISLHLMQKIR